MAEQGAGVERQDLSTESSEGSTTESERLLRETQKSDDSMTTAAKAVEETGGSSAQGDALPLQSIRAAATAVATAAATAVATSAVRPSVLGLAGVEMGESSRSRSTESSQSPLLSAVSTSSSDSAEVALVAANTARGAAASCRIVMTATLDAATVGKKRVDTALQRAEDSAELEDVTHYRNLAATYNSAVRLAARNAYEVEVAADAADAAAKAAEDAAKKLTEVGGETSTEDERIQTAFWATNAANMAAIVAFKMEYQALCAMKLCWKHIDDAENAGTTRDNWRRRLSAYGQNCQPNDQKFFKVAQIVSFLLGCVILSSLELFRYSNDSYYSVLLVGIILVGWSVLHAAYNLWVCYRKYRMQFKINKTRLIIGSIDGRVHELSNYFIENRILPPVCTDTFLD